MTSLHLEHDGVTYRPFASGEHQQAVELQREIWDPEMATPIHQLIAAQGCGGVLLGAFADDVDREEPGRCIGFCYGFVAHGAGETWMHSHQTGVAPGHRDRSIGETLKWLQRRWVLDAGHHRITWTFDPLRCRNAYVNLEKLGAVTSTYKRDYYGELPDDMNVGLPSDRLWAEWHLTSERVVTRLVDFARRAGVDAAALGLDGPPPAERRRRQVGPADEAPAAFGSRAEGPGLRLPSEQVRLDLETAAVRVEIPSDLDAVRGSLGDEAALTWRLRVREALTGYFDRGYVASGLRTSTGEHGRRGWYLLERPSEASPSAG